MKNSKKMNKAIDAAYEQIHSMTDEEFRTALKAHENTELSKLLRIVFGAEENNWEGKATVIRCVGDEMMVRISKKFKHGQRVKVTIEPIRKKSK